MEGLLLFLALLGSALLLGLAAVSFSLVWTCYYREGLGWDGGAPEFNWHPVLMVTGFIFVQGLAIIVYRLPWTWKCNKLLMKLIHAGLNSIAFTLAVISLVAVFDFHNAKKIPNMYSLHSWIGLTAVILYGLQIFVGIAVFLFPFAPASLRAAIMPIHVYSGLFLFGTVIATALMGITEKLIFSLRIPEPRYSDFPDEALVVNTLGVILVVFGVLVLWVVTRAHWKRPAENTSKLQQNVGRLDYNEEGLVMADESAVEANGEAVARKRNPILDEAGQRSTM
ncbi:plasma membrane ascorbate-dependent reductase CYBRD1 [Anolis carolinensis]|nr:PREDICTED: cytochrome b reductase 1 [Anolis carolinensis]|eukprot:XP_003226215.2 PREDICTED: cytochrome b reductase 1 [Anolis carolinensis]